MQNHRCALGIPAAPRIRPIAWPPERLRLLGTAPDEEIARKLRLKTNTIINRRQALGIPKFGSKVRCFWTPKEDRLLGTMPDAAVARRVGRSTGAVMSRRHQIGVPRFQDKVSHPEIYSTTYAPGSGSRAGQSLRS